MLKTILILGAGLEQAIAIKEAKKIGLNVVACDQNKNAFGFKYADVSIVIDITNIDLVLDVAIQNKVHGIFTHAVEIPHIVAEVAATLGLPGIPLNVAHRATNKIQRIACLTDNGIPCAKFEVANNRGELLNKAEKIGFPLVLKPVDSAGARGVQLVSDEIDLIAAYKEAIKYSKEKQVLLEEVLSGPEVSTESVVYKGIAHTFALADRNYDKSEQFRPFYIEDGVNYPSNLSDEIQKSIYTLVEKTIDILGIKFGAAKGDIIIDKGVPKIIEMAARTSGGWFGAGSIPAATGCNMLKPLIQMAVGDAPDLGALKPTRNLGCAQRYVIPVQEGVVTKITGCKEALKKEGVVMSELFLPKIGDYIHLAKSHSDRFGQIICTAKTREDAIKSCESAVSKIKIEVKSGKVHE